MDQGEEIRFRVTDEVFVDTSPTGPATAASDTAAQPGQSTAPPKEDGGEKKEAPYTLIVRKYTFLSSSINIIKLCFTNAIGFKSKVKMWLKCSEIADFQLLIQSVSQKKLYWLFKKFIHSQDFQLENWFCGLTFLLLFTVICIWGQKRCQWQWKKQSLSWKSQIKTCQRSTAETSVGGKSTSWWRTDQRSNLKRPEKTTEDN